MVVEVKVKLSLWTTGRHVGGVELFIYSFITSALNGDELSDLCPGRFSPRRRASFTLCKDAWTPKLA
jgi:hypothetical protein